MRTIHRLSTNRLATLGAIAIVFILFVAILAPILVPHDPMQVHPRDRFKPPGEGGYLLGTDEVGRDVFSRVIYGARVSLLVAGLAVGSATLFGGILGVLSGYFGGWVDGVFMRIVDVLFAIPTIMIALSVIGLFGRSTLAIIFALTVGYLPMFARVSYSATVSVREHAFVESSLALGSGAMRILVKDILPNIFPLLVVQVTAYIARAILAEATLGFLGLGVQPPTPTWGEMLSSSRNFFQHSLTLPLWPGIAVMVTVFAFNLFGDGLRDVLDPRAWQAGE